MAIIKGSHDNIRVRIVKQPTEHGKREYYDEYAPVFPLISNENELMRYFVPELGSFGVEISFKKGYDPGNINRGFDVVIQDAATDSEMIHSIREIFDERPLRRTKTILLKTVPCAMVTGEQKANTELCFRSLQPDKNILPDGNDPAGDYVELLCSFRVILTSITQDPNNAPEAKFKSHQNAHRRLSKSKTNTLREVQRISLKTCDDQGLTHYIGLQGGTQDNTGLLPPKKIFSAKSSDVRLIYRYWGRSSVYLTNCRWEKTPIPIQNYDWAALVGKGEAACKRAFKKLQEAEQKLELEAQLDGREEIDRDRIRDHFYEAANFSQEWPAWENLSNPQRELYFTQLQTRKKYREANGTWVQRPAIRKAGEHSIHSARSSVIAANVLEPHGLANNLDVSSLPTSRRTSKTYFDLTEGLTDESADEDVGEPLRVPAAPLNIKQESSLGDLRHPSAQASSKRGIRLEDIDSSSGSSTKKVKIEAGSVYTEEAQNDDDDLETLQEERRRIAEELKVHKTMAELYQQGAENAAKIKRAKLRSRSGDSAGR